MPSRHLTPIYLVQTHIRTHTLRNEQKEALKTTCQRILQEKIDAGLLKPNELDEQAVGLLTRYDGGTAALILETYCAEDRDKLRNPSAFFMMLAKRVVEEGVEGMMMMMPTSSSSQGKTASSVSVSTAAGRTGQQGEPVVKRRRTGAEGDEDRAVLQDNQTETKVMAPPPLEEEDDDGDDEDDGRGWGTPHVGMVRDENEHHHHRHPEEVGQTRKSSRSEDDYDFSRVFGSVRGRGGFTARGRGGRGRPR